MIIQSLLLTGPKQLEWVESDLPELKDNELLIRTTAGAISIGTELPQFLGTATNETQPRYPRMTGYESLGEVIAVGESVKEYKPGDRAISFYGHRTYGIVKEEQALHVPAGFNDALALLVILSCDSAKGVLKLAPERESSILIAGGGTMGLLTLFFLKAYFGVNQVDLIEPIRERHEIAREIGARKIVMPSDNLEEEYDYGFECSGQNNGFENLQRHLKKDGAICVLSDGNYGRLVLLPEFHTKELKIAASSDGWDYKKHGGWYFQEVKNNPQLEKIIQRIVPADNLISCFRDLADRNINPIKILVSYEKVSL